MQRRFGGVLPCSSTSAYCWYAVLLVGLSRALDSMTREVLEWERKALLKGDIHQTRQPPCGYVKPRSFRVTTSNESARATYSAYTRSPGKQSSKCPEAGWRPSPSTRRSRSSGKPLRYARCADNNGKEHFRGDRS